MGFPAESVHQALEACGGNGEAALNQLLAAPNIMY